MHCIAIVGAILVIACDAWHWGALWAITRIAYTWLIDDDSLSFAVFLRLRIRVPPARPFVLARINGAVATKPVRPSARCGSNCGLLMMSSPPLPESAPRADRAGSRG